MPIYVYQVVRDDGSEGETFEVEQNMSAEPLTSHPLTGEPVRRVFQPPNLTTKYTPGSTKKRLDDKNVAKAGFSKYVRDKMTGRYYKTAGSEGPDTLAPNG